MSRLFLHCALCGRKQADGLLSRGYWGQLDTGNGTPLRACPTCKGTHDDWEERLRVTLVDVRVVAPSQADVGSNLRAS
jgi:hypothetical protein